MSDFLKDKVEYFKESSIGTKVEILFLIVMAPILIFACLESFVDFLNREPQQPSPIPLSDSEKFQNCIESIKDYEDPRFDSAIESCMDIGLYRE
jgi:hypothetical protein